MKSFKSTASKIKNSSFFFNKSLDVILIEPPPRRRGPAPRPPPSYASASTYILHIKYSVLQMKFKLEHFEISNSPIF